MYYHYQYVQSSKRKPNKIQIDQDSEFYNIPSKKWLKENHLEIYLTYNKGRSVEKDSVLTALSKKCLLINVLNDIVEKYNNKAYFNETYRS